MSSYWANFAANGDPNGKDFPVWPSFDATSPTVMEVGDNFAPTLVADDTRLESSRPALRKLLKGL